MPVRAHSDVREHRAGKIRNVRQVTVTFPKKLCKDEKQAAVKNKNIQMSGEGNI